MTSGRQAAKRGISATVKFTGRGAIEGFFIKSFSSCKDLLPNNAIYQGFCRISTP
jgi:hypothetical protein